jgi:hypothetical protein
MHFAKEHRYKHFLITIYETENGLFRALISRADAQQIKTIDGGSYADIPTNLYDAAEQATEEARRMIDGGGMS